MGNNVLKFSVHVLCMHYVPETVMCTTMYIYCVMYVFDNHLSEEDVIIKILKQMKKLL